MRHGAGADAGGHYRKLIECLPYAFFAVDAGGRITDVNDATTELVGRGREELLGSTFEPFIAEEDRARATELFRETLAGERDRVEVELHVARPDGERRLVHATSRALRDGEDVVGSEGILRDITRERATSEQLVRSEARLRFLLSRLPALVWTVDEAMRVTWDGGRGAEGSFVGRALPEALEGKAPDAVDAHRNALAGRPASYDLVWGDRYFDCRVEPLVEGGRTVGAIGVAIEVTERVEAERRLDEQRAYRREFFRAAPEGIVVLDREGRVLSANPEFHRMFGYTASEAEGRNIVELIVPRDRIGEARDLKRRALGGDRLNVEAVRRRRDGSQLHVSILATPVTAGSESRLIAIYRDVTEQRRLEEQLLQSQRLEAVGQLAGGVAHEFNNIMTAILGHARVLQAEVGEGPVFDDLAQIEASAERAAALVRQLLAFSRRQHSSRRTLSLTQVVSEMRPLLEGLGGERVRLEAELDPTLPLVSVDPGQMEQVLVNLVMNARDAMAAGGTIHVTTGAVLGGLDGRDAVYVEVVDDGTGMSDEERARMFEPFFSTKGPGEGRGLGLSMVYGIVEQAGGRIRVRSEAGRGTTVRVVLPAAEPGTLVSPVPAGDRRRTAARGGAIVLVDDDRPVREVTRRILERHGFEVLAAASGAEALERLGDLDEAPGLLLTDVVMPGMTGPALATELAELWPGTPVLFMSGYTENDIPDEGPERDQTFISKPFDPNTLVRRVREILGSRRAPS